MKTTLFDLNKHAFETACATLGKPGLAAQTMKLEAFKTSGFDERDFPQWETFYNAHVDGFAWQSRTPSPAAAQDQHQEC